jgi:hypothetical protein
MSLYKIPAPAAGLRLLPRLPLYGCIFGLFSEYILELFELRSDLSFSTLDHGRVSRLSLNRHF